MSDPDLRHRVAGVLKREGVTGVVSRLVAKVAEIRTQVLLECDLDTWHPPAMPDGVRFAWASMADLEAFAVLDLVATPRTRAVSDARLRRGDRCLVGCCGDVPATYLWITTTVRELARLDWPVRPDAVFVYKTFTVDAWRGRGLNQAAVTWALDDCRRSGARTAFVDVDAANHASLRALRRAGFADVARFRTLKLGPATLTLMDDAVFSRVAGRSRRDRSGSSAAAKEHPCPR